MRTKEFLLLSVSSIVFGLLGLLFLCFWNPLHLESALRTRGPILGHDIWAPTVSLDIVGIFQGPLFHGDFVFLPIPRPASLGRSIHSLWVRGPIPAESICPAFPTSPSPVTRPGVCKPVFVSVGIRMPILASESVSGRGPRGVLGYSNGFEVVGVAASGISTQVIKDKSIGDWADVDLVGFSMYENRLVVLLDELIPSHCCSIAGPFPAPSHGIYDYPVYDEFLVDDIGWHSLNFCVAKIQKRATLC